MAFSPADRAAWSAYETANARARDAYQGGHRAVCIGCGCTHRTQRNKWCDRACYLATVTRKDAA